MIPSPSPPMGARSNRSAKELPVRRLAEIWRPLNPPKEGLATYGAASEERLSRHPAFDARRCSTRSHQRHRDGHRQHIDDGPEGRPGRQKRRLGAPDVQLPREPGGLDHEKPRHAAADNGRADGVVQFGSSQKNVARRDEGGAEGRQVRVASGPCATRSSRLPPSLPNPQAANQLPLSVGWQRLNRPFPRRQASHLHKGSG